MLHQNTKTITKILNDLENANVKIEQEKVKIEALLTGIGDGVIAVDVSGRIIYANNVAANLFGFTIDEMIGKLFDEIWQIKDARGRILSKDKRPIYRAITLGKKITTLISENYYYVRKDKTAFPVMITVFPIVSRGKIIGVIDIFRDITHEKEIDKAKSEFVSLASHQLRTPLSAIGCYTEMLLTGDAGKVNREQRKYLNEVYNGNRRMSELVDALLNVSRIELGTFAIEAKPTNIFKIVDDILHELSMQIKTKKIKVKKIYDKKSIKVINADPRLLRIIFENLLSNAVKYTPEKGHILFEITKKEPNILIRMADNGWGIPKYQQDKVFTKLFRGDNIRINVPDGTGLGLYITKAIVKQSGGKIWFESEENKGTTFYVSLPRSGMKAKEGMKGLEGSVY